MRTGSHLRAFFKGQQHKEFAWFAVAAALPGLSMDAPRAARRIVRAGLARRAELTLTPAAKVAVRLQGLFPGATARLLGVVNRLLPSAGPDAPPVPDSPPVPGGSASARLDSRLLRAVTVLGRSAARRYHQTVGTRATP
jgi:hypothetical protein